MPSTRVTVSHTVLKMVEGLSLVSVGMYGWDLDNLTIR